MDKEQMKKPIQPWEFRAKPAWQRLIIMLGGVTVNFILGFLIFAFIFSFYGESYIKTEDVTHGIAVGELGEQLGLKDGDKVIAVGDLKLEKFSSATVKQEIVVNTPQDLTVIRNGKKVKLPIPTDMAKTITNQANKAKMLYTYRLPQSIANVAEGSLAEKLGLKTGDKIIGIDSTAIGYAHELSKSLAGRPNETVNITYLRNNDTLSVTGMLSAESTLGVQSDGVLDHFYSFQTKKYGIAEALPMGVKQGVGFIGDQLKAFGKMFKKDLNATDNIGSIVSMAQLFDSSWNWQRFWTITAMLSILLGFFNLLPIPALDGGYVMFLLWEVITGRKVSDKVMEYATTVGFFILISFMIFALGLDFSRLF